MTTSQPPASDLRRLVGRILMVIGVLWLVFAGLCGLAYIFSFWRDGDPLQGGAPMRFDEIVGVTLLVVVPSTIIGGLIGGLIYAIGHWLRSDE
jgi:hypothetical protein